MYFMKRCPFHILNKFATVYLNTETFLDILTEGVGACILRSLLNDPAFGL